MRYTRKVLGRWGFTFQKPAFVAYEQNARAVQKWLKEIYPHIKKKAQRQGGLIFWLDEMGLRSQDTSGKSYAPKGKTPVLSKSGKRFYLNLLTAMSNEGKLVCTVVGKSFNTAVYIRFLQKLLRSVRQKLFLITDSHPVHVSKQAGEWLGPKRKKIEVFYLPNYSPELNPVEYFNQDVKNNVAGKRRACSIEELKETVEMFIRQKKKKPDRVKDYFKANPVNYAATRTKLGPR